MKTSTRIALAAAGLAAITVPAAGYAHADSTMTAAAPGCPGLHIHAVGFTAAPAGSAGPNNVVDVTIDGFTGRFWFDGTFDQNFPYGATGTAPHAWTVAIDADVETGAATNGDSITVGTDATCDVTITAPALSPAPATPTPATPGPIDQPATVDLTPAPAAPLEAPAAATRLAYVPTWVAQLVGL